MAKDPQEALDYARRRWEELQEDNPSEVNENLRTVSEYLAKYLEDAGFDPNKDESYEQIAPGLTRYTLDQYHLWFLIRDALETYHAGRNSRDDRYLGENNAKQLYALKRVKKQLPKIQVGLEDVGTPLGKMDEITITELRALIEMDKNGTLDRQIKKVAQAAAIDRFKAVMRFKREIEDKEAKGEQAPGTPVEEGLGYVSHVLKHIEDAGDAYQEKDILIKARAVWESGDIKDRFSKAAAEGYRRFFLGKNVQRLFNDAVKFQDAGHFVLDISGGGFGVNVPPFQHLTERMEKHGVDPSDEAFYREIGTDIETFKDHYCKEREAVSKDEKYKNLLKPSVF